MSIPTKSYFIVFERDLSQKKEFIYHVNFFYLKSLKKQKKGSLTYITTPFFRGTVLIGLDIKNKMRPLKFSKLQKRGGERPVDPKIFKRFLLADSNQFVAFSDQADSHDYQPIIEMLQSFQFSEEKIKELTFCYSCLEKRKFNILEKGVQIKAQNGRIICAKCALQSIIKDAKFAGLIEGKDRINPKLKNFFNHMLLKFKDVGKVVNTLKPTFNPAKNKEITLYDVEETTKVSARYLDVRINKIEIPENLKSSLKKRKIEKLLPIQAISIERGLLSKRNNQLIMAPTSGGKTLVGELAGVSRAMEDKRKMLYVVPIVALANIRETEFKQYYADLNLNVVKKVGESLFEKRDIDALERLKNADIIIATYEAIDHVLRSGNLDVLGDIGTIVIDEIQVLIEEERGFLLDGFISRLKVIYPDAQYLYLSATIGEPKELAQKLNAHLIEYKNRPVPVERHLVLTQNETMKKRLIAKLIRAAFFKESHFGFKGQSIVFSNSRKKCEALASYLSRQGVYISAYHGGLTNEERKIIEDKFQKQRIAGVVTTAALAAGVDLPASQVIFESLAMGIKWLTVAEFEQMLGRAGRLKKHEKGEVYLMVEPGKIYNPKMKKTEENIAIRLLNGKIKDFELEPDGNRSLTELLAFISMYSEGVSREEIYGFHNNLINDEYDVNASISKLISLNLSEQGNNGKVKITSLGRALAKSFFTVDQGLDIIADLKNREKSLIDIALELKPIRNVYLSKNVVADLSKNVRMKYFSNNFFSASVLSLMDAEYIKKRKSFSLEFIDYVMKWTKEIFNCTCKDNPYCDCGRLNLERILLDLRIKDHFTINEINDILENEYKIQIFKGDLIDYYENLIYSLESIRNISEGIEDLDKEYKNELEFIPYIAEEIKKI